MGYTLIIGRLAKACYLPTLHLMHQPMESHNTPQKMQMIACYIRLMS